MIFASNIERLEKNKYFRFPHIQTQRFLSLIGNTAYDKVCEIGCGKGYWSYILVRYNLIKNSMWGCDIHNDYRITEIKSVNPAIEVKYAGIENDRLPFNNEVFDFVFSVDVIEHLKDARMLLAEHIRVARPGAIVLVITPNYFRPANIGLMMVNGLKYPRRLGEGRYSDMVHEKEYSARDLLKLAELFSNNIEAGTLNIIPCWLGIPATNIGTDKFPKFLGRFCHSLFMLFKKRV